MRLLSNEARDLAPVRNGHETEFMARPTQDTPLIHYWDALMAHKGVLALSILCGLLIAALVTVSMRPLYQAKGVIELQPPPSTGYGRDSAAAQDVNGQTFDSYIDTQIGILQSDTLLRRVIARIHFGERLASYEPHGLAALRTKVLPFTYSRHNSPEQILDNAKRNLNVRQSRLNNLIEIYFNAHDPALAAEFVNTLADEYAAQNLETRWEMAQSAGNWLTRHLTDLRSKLEASESTLQSYSQSHGLLLADDNQSVAREKLHQVQEELSKAESRRMTKQAEMEMAGASKPESVPQVLDNSALKDYEVKLADLQRQLAELRQVYTASNPKVVAVQSQIETLQATADKKQSNVIARLHNEFSSAQRDEQMLRAEYEKQNRIVGNEDEQMIHYNTLKHEVDSNRAIYESLLQKVKESSVSVALQATNIRVVDAAIAPTKPYKPDLPVNLAGGLMAGLIVGLTSATLRHRSSQAVYRPGVTQRFMLARELGVIPSAHRGWPREAIGESEYQRPGLLRAGRGKPDRLRAWLNPNSAASESFRSVMTSLLFAMEDPGVRIVMITSPGSGEGKTTVTSNLGAAFAATGRRVLLVDADLRRPRLHVVFGLPSFPGVHEFSSSIPADTGPAALDRFVQSTGVRNLSLMASGDHTSCESNLVHTLRFRETFAALRRHFDMILVDAPPLPWVPEARVMARLADGVVMVMRAGATRLEDAVLAEKHVHEDGGRLIGTVLNDAPRDVAQYYGRYSEAVTEN
jgi:capsular exopolysaccharide synthesis family protein